MKDNELDTDEALLKSFLQGDEHAFKMIYQRHSSGLYASAYNLFRNKPLCEDLVQELFTDLWINRRKLNIKSVRPYLYTSIKNRVLMAIRSGKVMLGEEALEKLIADYAADSKLNVSELNNILNQSIESLPNRCREIFYLSRREHLSNKQIAERLKISVKTVESQMTIALRRLREQAAEFMATVFIITIYGLLK